MNTDHLKELVEKDVVIRLVDSTEFRGVLEAYDVDDCRAVLKCDRIIQMVNPGQVRVVPKNRVWVDCTKAVAVVEQLEATADAIQAAQLQIPFPPPK